MSSEWLDSVARHRPHRPTRSEYNNGTQVRAQETDLGTLEPPTQAQDLIASAEGEGETAGEKSSGPTPTSSITRVLREASSPGDAYSWACAGVAGGSGIAGAGSGGFALRAFTTFARDTLLREEWGVFFAFRADWRDGRLAVPAAERAPAVTASGLAARPPDEPVAGVSSAPPFAASAGSVVGGRGPAFTSAANRRASSGLASAMHIRGTRACASSSGCIATPFW